MNMDQCAKKKFENSTWYQSLVFLNGGGFFMEHAYKEDIFPIQKSFKKQHFSIDRREEFVIACKQEKPKFLGAFFLRI